MRKPTLPEAAFLAVTSTTAVVSSAILVPEIAEEVGQAMQQAAQSSTPENDFNNGYLAGGITVASGVGAVMYKKANEP